MYYTIQNGNLITAMNRGALAKYYDKVQILPDDYVERKYIVENGKLVFNTMYEQEVQEKEAERLSKLSLTKREVFLAIYKNSGLTPDEIRAGISDAEALIEFEYANEYYRGNPLIDLIGSSLGYTKADLDYLFENKELPIKDTANGGEEDA